MRRGIFLLLLFSSLLFSASKDIRPYLQTGPWYPSDAVELRRMLDGFFAPLPAPGNGGMACAIIAPHAGYSYSGRCAAAAYGALAPEPGVRRVILMGASHRRGFHGAVVDDYAAWSTPLGAVAVDAEACRALAAKPLFSQDRDAMRLEHSLENQLPFLQRALGNEGMRLVPILFGSLDRKEFAKAAAAIAPFIDGRTLVVVSSDLTHYGDAYGYVPFRRDLAANLEKLDKGFIDAILRLDFDRCFAYREKTGITACGFVPIGVMIRLFEQKGCRATLADYRKSGDLNHDYATSVSYASLLISKESAQAGPAASLDRREQKLLLELARAALAGHFSGQQAFPGAEERFSSSPRLSRETGVFVTLRKKGELRGCIGSIVGSEPLFRGVAANALHAAFHDPRFPPLAENELDKVEIEVSVMTPLQPIADWRAIRLGTDGVIIRDGAAQAVFLPQVATETGWSLDEFLGNLCLKAGLARNAYRTSPAMTFRIFQAQVFREKDPGR